MLANAVAHLRGPSSAPCIAAMATRFMWWPCIICRPPCEAHARQDPFLPEPEAGLRRASRTTGRSSTSPTSRSTAGYLEATQRGCRVEPAAFARCLAFRCSRTSADRRHRHLSPGGPPVHRQADRAGAELRRQAVIAIENTRLLNELREFACSNRPPPPEVLQVISSLARRVGAGVPGHAGERDAVSARPILEPCSCGDGESFCAARPWSMRHRLRRIQQRRGPFRPAPGPSSIARADRSCRRYPDGAPSSPPIAVAAPARRRCARSSPCRCSRTTS